VTNPRWRKNADSGKRLGQNFFNQPLTFDSCHGYLFENSGCRGTVIGTNWKIDGNICLKFSKLALRLVPRFSAWGFGQIWKKTWSEFFQASPDGRWVVMATYFEHWRSRCSSTLCRLGVWPNPEKDLFRICVGRTLLGGNKSQYM
jgi:hypothetical protein